MTEPTPIADEQRKAVLLASQKSVADGVAKGKAADAKAIKEGTNKIVKPATKGLGTVSPNVNKGETKIKRLG